MRLKKQACFKIVRSHNSRQSRRRGPVIVGKAEDEAHDSVLHRKEVFIMNQRETFEFDEYDEEDALIVCNEDETISFEEWQEEDSKGPNMEELIEMIYDWGDDIENLNVESLDESSLSQLVSLLKEFKASLTFASEQVQSFLNSLEESEDDYE